jgi:hypothetical protein
MIFRGYIGKKNDVFRPISYVKRLICRFKTTIYLTLLFHNTHSKCDIKKTNNVHIEGSKFFLMVGLFNSIL